MANDNAKTLKRAAQVLGYDHIQWSEIDDCFVGIGSSDPFDRSALGSAFVCWSIAELTQIVERENRQQEEAE